MAEREGFESPGNVNSTTCSGTVGCFGHQKHSKSALTDCKWIVDYEAGQTEGIVSTRISHWLPSCGTGRLATLDDESSTVEAVPAAPRFAIR